MYWFFLSVEHKIQPSLSCKWFGYALSSYKFFKHNKLHKKLSKQVKKKAILIALNSLYYEIRSDFLQSTNYQAYSNVKNFKLYKSISILFSWQTSRKTSHGYTNTFKIIFNFVDTVYNNT